MKPTPAQETTMPNSPEIIDPVSLVDRLLQECVDRGGEPKAVSMGGLALGHFLYQLTNGDLRYVWEGRTMSVLLDEENDDLIRIGIEEGE